MIIGVRTAVRNIAGDESYIEGSFCTGMVKSKENILSQFGELELTEYGDFAIRKELVEDYSPIDIHAHCFVSISGMLPGIMRKQKYDYFNSPFYDLSCYPGKINNFDFDDGRILNLLGYLHDTGKPVIS